MNNNRTLVDLYKDIVLVTLIHFFCTTLFTNNNKKVVFQMQAFQFDNYHIKIVNKIAS